MEATTLPQEHTDQHLSPVAAKMFLAALPEHIQRALLAHATETEYPVEMVLEMAFTKCLCKRIAGFLDSESLTFVDCKSEYL
jgi:hypothetical protein